MANHYHATQSQMYYAAERKMGERDQAFFALVNHPTNPLTNDDLRKLVDRRPDYYGRYAGYIGKLGVYASKINH